jgi:hypothetical protein
VSTIQGRTVIPVTFDPAAPVPVLSVTPNSNLGWSTSATVHGSGFVPDQELLVTQCAGPGPFDDLRCVGVVYKSHPVTDGTGAFTFPIKIRRLISSNRSREPSVVDCALVDCFVRVSFPPFNREDRVSLYKRGPVDAPLDIVDDGIPVVLMGKSFGQNEQHPVVNINIDLTQPAQAPFAVTYSTATAVDSPYAPATAGSDYVAKVNHHLYFLPGETHHQISISILDDATPEPVEVFAVNLSGYFHAIRRTVDVGIGDNDR